MKNPNIEGIIPPIITSFTEDDKIYEVGIRNVVDFQIKYVNGFYVCGSYGGGPLMNTEERMKVLEIILDEVNNRVPVIAHVGATSTKNTILLAKNAELAGVDAIGIVPPYYYSYPDENLLVHYKTICEEVNVPVYAYDNPKFSNDSISVNLIRELSNVGVAGIKDSSFSILSLMDKMMALEETNFNFIIGTESLFLPAFYIGVKACISGLANAFPELMQKLYNVMINGDLESARKFQFKVNQAREIIHYAPTIASIHAILEHRGINAGFPRAPFLKLEKKKKARIIQSLINLGLLNQNNLT